jgi:Domain of Unknown Function (DUF928)
MKSVRRLSALLIVTFACCPVGLLLAALVSVLVTPALGSRSSASPRSDGYSSSADPGSTNASQQQSPKSGATPKPKRKLDADLSGFDVSDDKSAKRVSSMLGGSRSTAIPSATLLAPRRAKLYGASADFLWSFTGHSDGYVLLITDEDETQIVRQQLNAPRYRFGAPLNKFQPGETYFWRVQVLPNTLASEPLEFVVVSAEERQAIDQAIAAISAGDAYQAALARADIFTDHRLWFDALGAYGDLIAKFPDRAEPYEERGAIYAQIPATKSLSDADLARAAQLRK